MDVYHPLKNKALVCYSDRSYTFKCQKWFWFSSLGTWGHSNSSESSSARSEDTDQDKPNIIIDGQKEVHLKVSVADSAEGSIIMAPQDDYQIDATLDPKISHLPEKNVTDVRKQQSVCCHFL